jgi:hypothetical protein
MAGPESCTVVAVEVLVEGNLVSAVRIFLKLLSSSVDRTALNRIAEENAGESSRDLLCYLEQCELITGCGWAFHPKVVCN